MFGKILKGILGAVLGGGESLQPQQASRSSQPQQFSRSSQSQPSSLAADVDELCRKVADSSYIDSLKLGRSWVLPQMVSMSFDKTGTFSESKFYQSVSAIDYNKGWQILLRNYKALQRLERTDPSAFTRRAGWWSKDVAVAMAKYDVEVLEKGLAELVKAPKTFIKAGPFVLLKKLRGAANRYQRMFFVSAPSALSKWNSTNSRTLADLRAGFAQRLARIEQAVTPGELYDALVDYDSHRWAICRAEMPEAFVNAYVGDGAYTAMMTMVKHLGLSYKGSRDECLADIEAQVVLCGRDGRKLFRFCATRFFDRYVGGIFDYKAYRSRRR